MDLQSAKLLFAGMLKTLRDESYYMPKVLDIFYELPEAHQDSFVVWCAEKVGKWEDWRKDRDMYPDLLKGVMLHYSGREDFDEPTKEDLSRVIGEYCRSDNFNRAEKKSKGEKTLSEMIKEAKET